MEAFLSAVANFGFPIVVSGYLLLRMEKTLSGLSKEITELKDTLRSFQK
jgi:hypothetical protein